MNLTTKLTIGAGLSVILLFAILMLFGDGTYTYKKAFATIYGVEKHKKISGSIHFEETTSGTIRVFGEIKNLPPGAHGFTIHEYGDSCGQCKKLGPHYNPTDKLHGPRTVYTYRRGIDMTNDNRHVGDLGNITADKKGVVKIDFEDKVLKLGGKTNIVGRSLAIHAKEDDLGKQPSNESRLTGSSGAIIACGSIIHSKNE